MQDVAYGLVIAGGGLLTGCRQLEGCRLQSFERLLGLPRKLFEVGVQVLETRKFFAALFGQGDKARDVGAVLALEFLDCRDAGVGAVDIGSTHGRSGAEPQQVLADAFIRVGHFFERLQIIFVVGKLCRQGAQLRRENLHLVQETVFSAEHSLDFVQVAGFCFLLACAVDFFFEGFFLAFLEGCFRKFIELEF